MENPIELDHQIQDMLPLCHGLDSSSQHWRAGMFGAGDLSGEPLEPFHLLDQ